MQKIDYKKVKEKIYGIHCHNYHALAKKLGVSEYILKKQLDPENKNRNDDLAIELLKKICKVLEISFKELIS